MQINSERRMGGDRRCSNRSVAGQDWRWYESSLGTAAGGEYDPEDPYWEPIVGQDDD